jgi:hypothetical protein
MMELRLMGQGAGHAPFQARRKKRAQIQLNCAGPQDMALHDKKYKKTPDPARFPYKNNKSPTQSAHFKAAVHGTKFAYSQVSATSPGTSHAGIKHQ